MTGEAGLAWLDSLIESDVDYYSLHGLLLTCRLALPVLHCSSKI